MDKHAIVVGSGTCAREVAHRLAALGVTPVVVAQSETPGAALGDLGKISVIRGELRHRDTLLAAGIERAAQVEIVVDDDDLALVITMNARELNETARIVVNVEDEELADHFRTAGANVVIDPSRVLGRIMAVAGVAENVSGLIFSEDQGLQREIGVFRVAPGAFAAGKSVGESAVHEHAWILGTVRQGVFNWETGRSTVLLPGDELVVLGDVRSFERLRQLVAAGNPSS